MKKALAFILSIGLVFSLTACGGNAKTEQQATENVVSEEKTTEDSETEDTSDIAAEANEDNEIVFWSLLGGGDGELIDSMIEEYNAMNTGYTVKHYVQDWGEYYNKLSFAVLSGEAPDVGISHVTRLMQLADQGVIEPLENVAGADKIDWSNFINEVDKKAQVNGTAYAVPLDLHGFLLYYNTEILTEAGVISSPEEKPEINNFEDFLAALSKVKALEANTNDNKDDDIMPLALQTDGDVPYKVWYTFYLQSGGTPLLSEDGNELTIDDAASEKAIEALLTLYNEGYAGVFNNQWEDFKAGKSAFIINLTSDLLVFNTALEGNMGVMGLPAFFDNNKTFADSHSFIVPVKEKRSPEKEEAIIDFINWMVNSGKWMQTGHLPTTKTVYESEEYNALPFVQDYKDSIDGLTYMSGSKNCWLLSPPKTLQNFEKIYADRESIDPKDATAMIREGLDADK